MRSTPWKTRRQAVFHQTVRRNALASLSSFGSGLWPRLVLVVAMVVSPAWSVLGQGFLFKEADVRAHFQNNPAKVADWTQFSGMDADAGKALNAYQADPSMANAIRVLQQYKKFGSQDLRTAMFAADPILFQTIDIAKFDLVMRVQRSMVVDGKMKIGHVWRIGSTGDRHAALMEWATTGKGDIGALAADPRLQLVSDNSSKAYKAFSSDDDITFFAPRTADSFEASEQLNLSFIDAFIKYTIDNFQVALNPSEHCSIEALSPTNAYSIIRQRHPELDGWKPLPGFIQEFISSNPEKYNGFFAVEQLDQWAHAKGWITRDVVNPMGKSETKNADGTKTQRRNHTRYQEVYAEMNNGRTEPRGFPGDDLFGWMTNQHRQIFQTHAKDLADGELKYVRKYLLRMLGAWEDVHQKTGILEPPTLRGQSIGGLTGQQMTEVVNQMGEAELRAQIGEVLRESHGHIIDRIGEELSAEIRRVAANAPIGPEGGRQLDMSIWVLFESNPKLKKLVDGLAVAYTNVDQSVRDDLDAQLQARIDILESTENADDYYKGEIARYLKATRTEVHESVDVATRNIEAFRYMREHLGEKLNDHLSRLGEGQNLDVYILRVAEGKMVRSELHPRWDDNAGNFILRQLTPEDVAHDLRGIEKISQALGFPEFVQARFVRQYFEPEPSIAVQMLVDLHRLTSSDRIAGTYTAYYTDLNGVQQARTIQRTTLDVKMSLGLLGFKAAAATGKMIWDLSGKYDDGAKLLESMKTIFLDGNRVSEQRLAAYSQTVTSVLGWVDAVEWIGLKQPAILQYAGGTTGALWKLANDPFTDDAVTGFIAAVGRDLLTLYAPNAAAAMLVADISLWAWNKWEVSSSENAIIRLLVENGEWDVDDTGKRDPILKGYRVREGAPVETNFKKLALSPKEGPQEIQLIKSKQIVDPRKELLDLAHAGGYLKQDQGISAILDAMNDLVAPLSIWESWTGGRILFIGWSGGLPPSYDQKNWTQESLKNEYGVAVPTREDDRKFIRLPIYAIGVPGGSPWAKGVGEGLRKNFGYLVSQYWVRRQVLLEDVILKKLLDMAVKAKAKEELITPDPVVDLLLIEEMDQRLQDLEWRIWEQVAPSAAPFSEEDYDKVNDRHPNYREVTAAYPVTESFKAATRDQRLELEHFKDHPGMFSAAMMTTLSPELQSNPDVARQHIEFRVEVLMDQIVSKLQEYEKHYNDVLNVLAHAKKLVETGDGYDNTRFHLGLTGKPTDQWFGLKAEGDVKLTATWLKGYTEASDKTVTDVVARYRAGGILDLDPDAATLDRIVEMYPDWFIGIPAKVRAMVEGHPYWPYLLRLQLQIHKITLMEKVAAKMHPIELRDAVHNMKMDRKPVQIDGDIDTPEGRSAYLFELRALLGGEYQLLLDELLELFVVDLEMHGKEEIALLDAFDAELSVELSDKVTLDPDLIKNSIDHYEWTLWESDKRIVTQKTDDPKWQYYPMKTAELTLEAEVMAKGNLAMATVRIPVKVTPAKLMGHLTVTGDPPDQAFIHIFVDEKDMMTTVGGGHLEAEITEVSDLMLRKLGLTKSPTSGNTGAFDPPRGTARVFVDGRIDKVSDPAPVSASPGLIKIDEPLLLQYEAGVVIDVEVVDASDTEVAGSNITVSNGTTSMSTPDALVLPEPQPGDQIKVSVKRSQPVPGVRAEGTITVQPQQPLGIRIVLPFYDAGNLQVTGNFASTKPEPGVKVIGGSIDGNVIDQATVGSSGAFLFMNAKPVLLDPGVELTALLQGENNLLVKPSQSPISQVLKIGQNALFPDIPTETYTIDLNDFPIDVVDLTNSPMSGLKVTVGDRPAGPDASGLGYRGNWSFSRYQEVVRVRATHTLPDGRDVTEEGLVKLEDVDVSNPDQPVLPEPVKIIMPIHPPNTVVFSGRFEFSEPFDDLADKPSEVELAFGGLNVAPQLVDADAQFTVYNQQPLVAGQSISVFATAQKNGRSYSGDISVAILPRETLYRIGVITLSRLGQVTGTAVDDLIRQLQPIAGPFETERDQAIADCEYEKAANAQRNLVDAVDKFLAQAFPNGIPGSVQTVGDQFRQDLTKLEAAAAAEIAAKAALVSAREQLRGREIEAAMRSLETAMQTPDLASCLKDRIVSLYDRLEADIEGYAEKIDLVLEQVNACDYEKAETLGAEIETAAPRLSWVQTELPKIRKLAADQRKGRQLVAHAQTLEQQAIQLAQTDARAGVLKYNEAIEAAEEAVRTVPSCGVGPVEQYLDRLVAAANTLAAQGPTAASSSTSTSTATRSLVLLIDASGSMNDNDKIVHAKAAATQVVRSLGPNVEVALITYSGGCSNSFPVRQDFTTDKEAVVQAIQSIRPGGGTPMSPAITFASAYIADPSKRSPASKSAKLIVLSDGQNNCGSMSDAGQSVTRQGFPISVDAIGLGLPEGSQAEQDLETLVRTTGGQRQSASSPEELIRALRRSSISDQLKMSDPNADPVAQASIRQLFEQTAAYLAAGNYEAARMTLENAARQYPGSGPVHHNLSLAYEAEGQLASAVKEGEKYLQLEPNALDAGNVRARLDQLRRELAENPRAIFDPNQCPTLYRWAQTESSRARDATRKAEAFKIMVAAQRGDCPTASSEYEQYLTRYGGSR